MDKDNFSEDFLAQKTTKEFIENNINEILSDIEYLESQTGKVMVGERAFLDRPYEDCKDMSNFQVIYFFSMWRAGMFARVNGRTI